jgi:DNA-binding PadR family transcriptional regulator
MREYSSGEVTPHEAVLGLISQGRTTVADLRGRLEREFPHANYAPNTASTALRRLAAKGHVRLVEHGGEDARDIYEITRQGMNVLEDWLYDIVSVPAPQRDSIQAKLAFVPAGGVGRLVAIVRVLEEAAAQQYGVEHGKIKTLNIGGQVEGNPDLELQCIRHQFTANMWGQEAKRLAGLRKDLERFHAKHGGD